MKKLKLVIAGAGEVGFHLIENLCKEDLQLLVIDTNGEILEKLQNDYDIKTDQASIIDSKFMNNSYLNDVDLFLAITNSDETNMIACKKASDAGVKNTICRIRQIDFNSSNSIFSLESLGINSIINPVSLVAEEIFHLVQAPNIVDRYAFIAQSVYFVGFKIRSFSKLVNKSIADLEPELKKHGFKIGVVQRNDMSSIPNQDLIIQKGDIVYFFCKVNQFQMLRSFLGYQEKGSKQMRIFINGGGHIGVRLAKKLEQANHKVKIIEKDLSRSYRISDRLSKSLVLNFDGTDVKQLIAEGIENADFFISVTDNEKINLTSCLIAEQHGVKRTICLVQQPEFISIIDQKTPISLAISPRVLTTRYLAQFIQGANIQSYFPLSNSHIAVLELKLTELTPCLSIPLKDLQLPDDVVIGVIQRADDVLLPTGEDILQTDDIILLILHKLDREKAMQFFQPFSF